MNEMEQGMSNWLAKTINPDVQEWVRVCDKLTADSGVRAVCMKFAADYEGKKLGEEEFLASLANTTGKTLDEIDAVIGQVAEEKVGETTVEPAYDSRLDKIILVNTQDEVDKIVHDTAEKYNMRWSSVLDSTTNYNNLLTATEEAKRSCTNVAQITLLAQKYGIEPDELIAHLEVTGCKIENGELRCPTEK